MKQGNIGRKCTTGHHEHGYIDMFASVNTRCAAKGAQMVKRDGFISSLLSGFGVTTPAAKRAKTTW